jgi:glyoxalase family protein
MRGIHHVTAISGKPTRNLDFYTRTLGLRFVKKTVNFDDPGTYHFYYGDGLGLAQTTAFCVPAASIGYWTHRLIEKGVKHEALTKRFGEPVLSFFDPDGMSLALVGISGTEPEAAWSTSEIPAQHAIRGFHGVTLMLDAAAPTGAILTDVLGFTEAGREGPHVRYRANDGVGGVVDIREARGFLAGRMGRGSVHHVAFRAADDAEQAEMARKLVKSHGVHPTEQKDRQYFRSVYFREPGGVLFEIATDLPGFTIDEPLANLGQNLKLPPFLEPRRKELEAALPSLELVS